jgi:hypothetical protein
MGLDEAGSPDLRRVRRNTAISVVCVCVLGVFAVISLVERDWGHFARDMIAFVAVGWVTVLAWGSGSRMARLTAEAESRSAGAPKRWPDSAD